MKVERDPNRFKRFYPDKKAVLSKDHPPELDYVIHSSVGTLRLRLKAVNSNKKTSQVIAEFFIAAFIGIVIGSTVKNILSLVQKDLLIVSVVLFTTLLLTTWQGIRYLSIEWRAGLFKLLAGNDTLVANAIMGPNYGLLVTSGRDLIIINSTFYNSKDDITSVYVEGNSDAQVSDTTFIRVKVNG